MGETLSSASDLEGSHLGMQPALQLGNQIVFILTDDLKDRSAPVMSIKSGIWLRLYLVGDL